jgi:hypothetical protein
MVFSFVVRVGFSLPRGCAELFSGGMCRESSMVHDTHLFILQIHASRFRSGQEKMVLLFSVWHGVRRLSTG